MQKIKGTTIMLNRGDVLNLTLSVKVNGITDYTFQIGDKIVFSIYNKGKLNDSAVLVKEINILEETSTVTINLTSEETKLGEMKNKPVEYWYEVELNPDTAPQTVVCFDETGAKIFELYPEGADE